MVTLSNGFVIESADQFLCATCFVYNYVDPETCFCGRIMYCSQDYMPIHKYLLQNDLLDLKVYWPTFKVRNLDITADDFDNVYCKKCIADYNGITVRHILYINCIHCRNIYFTLMKMLITNVKENMVSTKGIAPQHICNKADFISFLHMLRIHYISLKEERRYEIASLLFPATTKNAANI